MSAHLWWQRGVIYQIYPRSYQDSDGDGVGDLRGIISRLDYVQWLGVDAIWLSPIYPSPMADFGYDVADYCDIHPLFGTLADFDDLVAEAHRRDLKVILDLVPNHSSNEHPWFLESRSSRESAKRDWYIWRDPGPDGGPPNNWLSFFGGRAWTYDEATGQYYLHSFLKEQPDLNWRNPEVQQAILDAMRFWLDRGVDGFRVDVIWLMIKDAQFRDNPPNPDWQEGHSSYSALLPHYTADQPEVHDVIATMRQLLDQYDERMMVGEIYLPIERLVTYYGINGAGAHLPFNFQLIQLSWNARTVAQAIDSYEAALPADGWPNWVLGNHDQHRIATRIGREQARVAAMLLLTLRGTPTLYYGDEIGMQDGEIPPELVQDPQEIGDPGKGLGRDPERTPMQWGGGPNAGFTTGTPWLPLAADYTTINVAAQRDDPAAPLTLTRRLLELRRATPALEVGTYTALPADGNLIAYRREAEGRSLAVVLNLSHLPQTYDAVALAGAVLLSTHLDRAGETIAGPILLRPDEGLIIEERKK
ncbi:MAG TPA: alpha-amylase family glycosyl hydrolase [Roseiflexaceae bacterium]|nr:alpha-amylase family glycosyl hydrolase [Roseiflexaceae bacterium]